MRNTDHCVHMHIRNYKLESVGWEANINFYSNPYDPKSDGKKICATLTKHTNDEFIDLIRENYVDTLEEAIEWLHSEAKKIVMEDLEEKEQIGRKASKDLEYINEYGFQL
jgi:hypothetical protein